MKKKSTGLLFITPFILFFMLFWLIPFIYGIVMSLSKYSLIMGNQGSAKEYSERFILPRILFRLLRWQLYLYG